MCLGVRGQGYGEVFAMNDDLRKGGENFFARIDLNKETFGRFNKVKQTEGNFQFWAGHVDPVRKLYYAYSEYHISTFDSVTLKQLDRQWLYDSAVLDIQVDASTGTVYSFRLEDGFNFAKVDPTTGEWEVLYNMGSDMGCYKDAMAFDSNSGSYFVLCDHYEDGLGSMVLEGSEESGEKSSQLYLHRVTLSDPSIVVDTSLPVDEVVLSLSYSSVIGKVIGWKSGVGVVSIDDQSGELALLIPADEMPGIPNLNALTCSHDRAVCYVNMFHGTDATYSVLFDVEAGRVIKSQINPGRHFWTNVAWQPTPQE